MNLSAASAMLPVNNRLKGAPRLTYLPRRSKRHSSPRHSLLSTLKRLWRMHTA